MGPELAAGWFKPQFQGKSLLNLPVRNINTFTGLKILFLLPFYHTYDYFKAKRYVCIMPQSSGCLIIVHYNNLDDKESVSIVPRLCEKFLGDGQTDSTVGEIGQVLD